MRHCPKNIIAKMEKKMRKLKATQIAVIAKHIVVINHSQLTFLALKLPLH